MLLDLCCWGVLVREGHGLQVRAQGGAGGGAWVARDACRPALRGRDGAQGGLRDKRLLLAVLHSEHGISQAAHCVSCCCAEGDCATQ
jgi:hypothetical protein